LKGEEDSLILVIGGEDVDQKEYKVPVTFQFRILNGSDYQVAFLHTENRKKWKKYFCFVFVRRSRDFSR